MDLSTCPLILPHLQISDNRNGFESTTLTLVIFCYLRTLEYGKSVMEIHFETNLIIYYLYC